MGKSIHISKRRWKISIQGYQNIGNRMCYLRWHCAIGDVDPCQNAYRMKIFLELEIRNGLLFFFVAKITTPIIENILFRRFLL